MRNHLTPDIILPAVTDITPDLCDRHGIRGLILDADNTLVPRMKYTLTADVAGWIGELQESGRKLCILSNSAKAGQVARMVAPHGMEAISLARKPFGSGFRKALRLLGTEPEETAMIGDQMMTDILGGNLAGMLTIMVSPLSSRDFILYSLVRPLERRLLKRWAPLEEVVEEQEAHDA